ncbi:hypothetical protein GCM10007036_19560 [Alsobacter metallidurans]|uniref:Uncharacterized protein n=1 Tax=Alsobacter metallidurans TaxID=340221 RepID=A0A917MHN0_9HYPH|nr:hypothetical protein [Alsobacter metallidurans]GGH17823.1 hypothetical protein GCM10007036_19560 [Alsobacter metallidurans]
MPAVERTHQCFSCGRMVPHGKAVRYTVQVEAEDDNKPKRMMLVFKRVKKLTRYACGDCYVSRTIRDLLAKLPDVALVVAALSGILYFLR